MDVRRRISFNGSENESINTDNYLTILALEDGLTASLSTNTCQYCVDSDGNWMDLPAGTATQTINQGQTLSFKGNLTPVSSTGIGTFTINKKCNIEGNCMSMLFGDDTVNNYSLDGKKYAFYKLFKSCTTIIEVSETFLPATTLASSCYYDMFYDCTSLTTAPELPATTLGQSCYSYMFYGCSSLTTAPELPATTLTYGCYQYMFNGCSSLTTAPELPATTLVSYCYQYMFRDCTNLTTAPELPATTLTYGCYQYMFRDCTNLTTAPELPATTLDSYCYSSMFYGCSSLTTAPELPATTLGQFCYSYMFYGCSSLTTAPELPATTLDSYCYRYMFYGCSSLTTAPELPATTLVSYCYQYMFNGCSSLTTAPELPATTLANYCYEYMFRNCSNLNYIKMLATDISARSCLNNWVSRVSSTGTFIKHPDMTSLPTGVDGIPSGWTVVDDGEEGGGDATNVIYYTSTDGNVVTPYATDVFGANIVSNTYSDSKGIIKFDGNVTTIGERAFFDCDGLTSVTIPNSVTTIGRNAFYNCSSLTSITIPNGVTNIGYGAFNYCTNLTNASLPDSVTNIGYGAFSSTRLTSITIPYSVTGIEGFAFGACTSLTSVYCKATTPPTLGNNNVFDSNGSGHKIYVPMESVEAYKSAGGWSYYADDIVGYDFENDTVVGGGSYLITEGYNSPTDVMDYLYNKYGICGSIDSPIEIVEEIYLENFPEHSKANGKATRLSVVNQTTMRLYTEDSMTVYYTVTLTKQDNGTFLATTVCYD